MNRLIHQTTGVFCAAMLTGAAVSAGAGGPEEAAPTPAPLLSTEISGSDLMFLTGAAPQMALLAELSDLAKKNAVTPEVQSEAATTWREQTDAAARLKALAGRVHVPVAAEPDDAGKQVLDALGKAKGMKFDKLFLDAQGDAQDQLEASLESGASSSDGEIKAFAQAGLGTLKQERERVRKLGL